MPLLLGHYRIGLLQQLPRGCTARHLRWLARRPQSFVKRFLGEEQALRAPFLCLLSGDKATLDEGNCLHAAFVSQLRCDNLVLVGGAQ